MNGNSKSSFIFWLLAPAIAAPLNCSATQYLTVEQAQRILFPATAIFVESSVPISKAERTIIEDQADTSFGEEVPKFSRVEQNGVRIGFFVVDNVIGKHDYITYAAALSDSGAILGVEILEYRENYGEAVRDIEWRQQFIGKTSADKLKLGGTINNISGATYSCRHITEGLRRILATYKVLYGSR